MPGFVSSTQAANIVLHFSILRKKEKEAGVLSPSTGSTRIPLATLLVAHVDGVHLMWEECFQWICFLLKTVFLLRHSLQHKDYSTDTPEQ